jgi:uncharacterized protein
LIANVDLSFIAPLLVIGAVVGFLAGLLGIGGGMIMVPFLGLVLTTNGFAAEHIVKVSIATSLATILFTSLSAVLSHHKNNNVQWKIVAAFSPGIVIGALMTAQFAAKVKDSWMAIFFGIFVGYMAVSMLRTGDKRKATKAIDQAVNPRLLAPLQLLGIGTVIGGLSALVGAGGGFMTTPYLNAKGVGLKQAIGTSAACGFPIALAGTIGYAVSGWQMQISPGAIGFVYLPALVIISGASMCTAPLGVKIATNAPTAKLKILFGAMLVGIALYMLYKGFATL